MNMLLAIAASPLLVTGILLYVDMSWVFLVALYLRNNSIVDIAYGLAFVLVAATTLYNFGEYPLGGLVTTLVCVWGLRLAIRIHERNRGKPEDFRYAHGGKSGCGLKRAATSKYLCCKGLLSF